MGFSWKIKEIQIAKGEVSKGKYPKREKVETEFAKDCFHYDLVIMWLSLVCIYLISTKIRVHLSFADDGKVGGIINTDNNHCIKLTVYFLYQGAVLRNEFIELWKKKYKSKHTVTNSTCFRCKMRLYQLEMTNSDKELGTLARGRSAVLVDYRMTPTSSAMKVSPIRW